MKMNKFLSTALACVTMFGCLSSTAGAIEVTSSIPTEYTIDIGTPWASGSFTMNVPAESAMIADSTFPLAAGETVRINASYTPDANMDFGLVDSDGKFYYFTVTNGSIDKTIRVSKSGHYTLQVRNNSSGTVNVSGFVNY